MVDLNNTNQVSQMTESCQILSDTLNMIENHVKPGQSVMELDKLAEEYNFAMERSNRSKWRPSPTRAPSSCLRSDQA